LRYSLFSPPWETNGLEVVPTESLNTWFGQRAAGNSNGTPSINVPPVVFNWAGPANGGTPGYYNWDYKNLGPRVALAWSPAFENGLLGSVFGGAGRSSIRAGFGIVYDRIGEGLLDTFDQNGAFGLSTTVPNAAASETVACSPRVTSLNAIPQLDNCGTAIFVPGPPPIRAILHLAVKQLPGAWIAALKRRTPIRWTSPYSGNCQAGLRFRLLTSEDLGTGCWRKTTWRCLLTLMIRKPGSTTLRPQPLWQRSTGNN